MGPPGNCHLCCFLLGPRPKEAPVQETEGYQDNKRAAVSSQWQGPNQGDEVHHSYDRVSKIHKPGPPEKMDKMGLFVIVLHPLPSRTPGVLTAGAHINQGMKCMLRGRWEGDRKGASLYWAADGGGGELTPPKC